MSNTTVTVGEVTIVAAELRGYTEDSFRILNAAESYKTEFKTMVEGAEKKTGLPKKVLSKYFKARFKDSEQGEVFAALDRALDGDTTPTLKSS